MGFGNFSGRGENDMILRNAGTGGMQVYDIKNNQITGSAFLGTVGLNWRMAGVSSTIIASALLISTPATAGGNISATRSLMANPTTSRCRAVFR